MNEIVIPRFGELLAPYLSAVPSEAYPFLLSELERTAAARYREWAEQLPKYRSGLTKCADAEDEIANRAAALFPASQNHQDLIAKIIPNAKAAYYAAFEPYHPAEQVYIQSKAERQGAGAWQRLKETYPEKADALDALSALELESADYLDGIMKDLLKNVAA